ncbi:transposase [Nonomuraea basaltis]|uniref:transposase n=1 Tax=Nonomuraea basaltis TaxID=2495887 RepID=UPI00110C5B53|nr:transposase [Nonomuraea basaltis]
MLGQVEGRTTPVVTGWLNERDAAWHPRVAFVAIDMCTICTSAVRAALPQARLVVDPFTSCNRATGGGRVERQGRPARPGPDPSRPDRGVHLGTTPVQTAPVDGVQLRRRSPSLSTQPRFS